MSAQFTHTARPPEAWHDLLQFSASVAGNSLYGQRISPGQGQQMLDRLNSLGNERLEQVRFFGLGEMISPYGQLLDEPPVLDETVELLTDELFAAHFKYYKTDTAGLRVMEIDGTQLISPMVKLAEKAKLKVPIEVALLTDSLQFISLNRRKSLMKKCSQPLPTFADVLDLRVSARDVGAFTLINAAKLVRDDLIDTYSRRKDLTWKRTVSINPTVRQIRSEAGFHKMQLLRVATYLAKLRIDEANDGSVASACIHRGQHANLQIDRSLVPDSPPPVSNKGVTDISQILIHTERLGCPAIHCAPIIDRILNLLPPVILNTDTDIRAA